MAHGDSARPRRGAFNSTPASRRSHAPASCARPILTQRAARVGQSERVSCPRPPTRNGPAADGDGPRGGAPWGSAPWRRGERGTPEEVGRCDWLMAEGRRGRGSRPHRGGQSRGEKGTTGGGAEARCARGSVRGCAAWCASAQAVPSRAVRAAHLLSPPSAAGLLP